MLIDLMGQGLGLGQLRGTWRKQARCGEEEGRLGWVLTVADTLDSSSSCCL